MARPTLYDDALRRRILDEAAAQIATGGPDHLSLRRVVAAAGTSTNAVYTLFGSRAGLVREVLGRALTEFLASQEAAPRTDDPMADLRTLGRTYRTWALSEPDLYRIMFGPHLGLPTPHAFEDMAVGLTVLTGALERAMRAGLLLDLDPLRTAVLFWSASHGFVSLEIDQWSGIPLAERDALYEQVLDRTVRPIRREPVPGG